MALDQHTGAQRRRHPPSCAHRHFVEPLFEGKPAHHAVPTTKCVRHCLSVREVDVELVYFNGWFGLVVAVGSYDNISVVVKGQVECVQQTASPARRCCLTAAPCGYVTCPGGPAKPPSNQSNQHHRIVASSSSDRGPSPSSCPTSHIPNPSNRTTTDSAINTKRMLSVRMRNCTRRSRHIVHIL